MDANVISNNVVEVQGTDTDFFLANESKFFTIDDATRKITPPNDFKYLGVESDSNSKRIWFECPRYVGDNINLTELNVYINYQNANGDKDRWYAEDVTVEGDKIHFSWKLSRKALKYKGTVKFIVCAIETDADGEKDPEWNTTLCQGTVLEGLEVENPEPDTPEYDIVNQLLDLCKGLANSVKTTEYDGVVLGDTETNQAYSANSVAGGYLSQAGSRGYKILSYSRISSDNTIHAFELSSTEGLEEGQIVSIRTTSHYVSCGTIEAFEGNTVEVTTTKAIQFKLETDPDDPEHFVMENYLTVDGHPELGDTIVAFNGFSFGEDCIAQERDTFSWGRKSKALGQYGYAGNRQTVAGYAAHAEGYQTTALGNYSHAEGHDTKAIGIYSHAEGLGSIADARASHAEGYATKASAEDAHSEGNTTLASGSASHAEGLTSQANGDYSHAEGHVNKAEGIYSHAEGDGTEANGKASHTEGHDTSALGDYSHAEGYRTIARGEHQHVDGRLNIEDTENKYAQITGNGDPRTNTRSNARTLDWDGNVWYAGTVETTGVILTSPNGTRFKLTVADDGSLKTEAV